MTASAPRYDPRVLAAIRRLDDERESIAETCRRVGEAAERLGITRPSYVHLRRIIKAERDRRHALEEIKRDVFRDVLSGRAPRLDDVLDAVREAQGRAELRRRS